MFALYDVVSRFYIAALRRSIDRKRVDLRSCLFPPFPSPPTLSFAFLSLVSLFSFLSFLHRTTTARVSDLALIATRVAIAILSRALRNARYVHIDSFNTNGQANDAHFLSITVTSSDRHPAINKLYDGGKRVAVNFK